MCLSYRMCIYSLLRLVALKSLLHLHNVSVLSYVYLLFIETGSTEVFGAFA